jgi:hypothetical protein
MYIGKTLFALLMDFLPWKTFHRIIDRHNGDRYVKSMTCADQFRVLAFAQLTYRESLRDIEVSRSAQAAKLYHTGFRHEIKRWTLADANESRDWRVHAEFAQCLITQTRKLYIGDSFGIELENTAYALDSTTIDLCLSLFPWALFRTTKSAVKMHTLLDLRGKKRLNLDASLYTLLQILSVTLFENMPLQQAFPGGGCKSIDAPQCNQRNLFNF